MDTSMSLAGISKVLATNQYANAVFYSSYPRTDLSHSNYLAT